MMIAKIKTISIAIIALFCITSSRSEAQDTKHEFEKSSSFSIETDPSTFVFHGYALHFRYKFKNNQHFLIGAGIYRMVMPDFMVNMNSENKDKGWHVIIESAYSLFGEYYFSKAHEDWFVGIQVGVENYKNSNIFIPPIKESAYSNFLIMPSIGYNWLPFDIPFYVKPWAGIAYTAKISGDNSIDNLNYDISPIVPFFTLHLGYTFSI